MTGRHHGHNGADGRRSPLRVGVLTVSDRSATGSRPDASGPLVERLVLAAAARVVARALVPDERHAIERQLRAWADGGAVDVVLTTGGTGLAPRDVTPEATLAVVDREVPGLPEMMRAVGSQTTPHAALSRQVAGLRGSALIVNLPGSPTAVAECLEAVLPVLHHAVAVASAAMPSGLDGSQHSPLVVAGLSEAPLDVAGLVGRIRRPECGAVVVFEGITRANSEGRSVLRLEYEAHEARAGAQLEALAREVAERHCVGGVVAVHRTGAVPPAEPAVVVAAAAAHRAEAFTAASNLIDRVKTEVAIWKKEVWAGGGSRWVGLAEQTSPAGGAPPAQIEA